MGSKKHPNVVFVVLDTARATSLSCYDHDRTTTPFLESFAKANTKYDYAYAPAPWTVPSHASLFTGAYEHVHRTNRAHKHLPEDIPTLAECVAAEGYETVGFSNNAYVTGEFGFDRGFDTFCENYRSTGEPFERGVSITHLRKKTGDGSFAVQVLQALMYAWAAEGSMSKSAMNWIYRKLSEAGLVELDDRGAGVTNQFVRQWLDNRDNNDPYFLFLNYMEAHAPYYAPPKHRLKFVDDPATRDWGELEEFFADGRSATVADLKDQYDGCLHYLDTRMEELVEIIDGHSRDTVVIITGDHGEGFGEHGIYEHKGGLYDEQIRVPLLIRDPTNRVSDTDRSVSLRWLPATILKLVGAEIPDTCVEETLWREPTAPVIANSEGIPAELLTGSRLDLERFSQKMIAAIDDEYKYIKYVDGSTLFERGGEDDGPVSRTERLERLASRLNEALDEYQKRERSGTERKISEVTRSRLEELGYLTR